MAFSANQRTYRKERHLNQQQLADAQDVSLGVISKLENGVSTPDLSILIEMAEVFRVSTDALFGAKLSLKYLDAIRSTLEQRDYSTCRELVEESLRRFPNHFPR